MPADSTIDTVIFDVGHVLYDWDMRHLFRRLTDDAAEVERIYREVVTPAWHFGHDAGRPTAAMVAERSAEFPADARYIRAWAERFNETIPGPMPGTHALVEALAARGVPLFAITNFGAEFWAGFRPTAPIFDLFGDIVVSGEEKVMKPDPAIYAIAIRRFGIRPEQAVFIDDRAENVAGGEDAGMAGHVFTDAKALQNALTGLGLLDR